MRSRGRFLEERAGAVESGVTEFELVAFSLEAEEDGQVGLVVLEQFGHNAQGILDARLEGSLPMLLGASRPVWLRACGGGEPVGDRMLLAGSGGHVIRRRRRSAATSCVDMPFPVASHGPRSPLRRRGLRHRAPM
ncbi:hypothetical protein MCRY_14425 [Marivita cryptomonadis]|nr:hypothetical protein MCRY_14425 [Marivita cryptomonadis]